MVYVLAVVVLVRGSDFVVGGGGCDGVVRPVAWKVYFGFQLFLRFKYSVGWLPLAAPGIISRGLRYLLPET